MSLITTGESLLTGWIRAMPVIIVYWFYLFHPVASESNLNLALGKSAYMSSTSPNHPASKAVDGNLMTSIEHCAQTMSGVTHVGYWYVDLGNTYRVTSVWITMRSGCCDSKLETATIYVSKIRYLSPTPNVYVPTEKCRDIKEINSTGLPRGVTTTISCASPKDGHFVYIQNRGSISMSLCEVQVYGMQAPHSSSRLPLVTSSTVSTTTKYSTTKSDQDVRTGTLGHYDMSRETSRSASPLSVRESFVTTTAFTSSRLPMKMGILITITVVPPLVLIILVILIIIGLKTRRKKDKAKPEDGYQPESEATEPLKDSKVPQSNEPDYEAVEETTHTQASSQGARGTVQSGKDALTQESKELEYEEVNKTTHNQGSSQGDNVQGSEAVLVLDGKVADLYARVNKEKNGKSANVINANADDIANLYAVPDKRKKKNNDGDAEIQNQKLSNPATASKIPGPMQEGKSKQKTDDQDFPLPPENAAKENISQGDQTNGAGYANTKYAYVQKNKSGSSEKESDYSEVEGDVTAMNPKNSDVEVTEKLAGEGNCMNEIVQGVEQAEDTESTYYNLGPATGREEISEANVYANV